MRWLSLACLVVLSGCGVIWPYAYDARDVEEHLSVAMSKEQVVKTLGYPSRAMPHDAQTTVWEYWRYPKGEWLGYLIHCPFHPYCYVPAEPRNPYYVALRNDRVCLWGTPDVVRALLAKVCGAEGAAPVPRNARAKTGVSVIPVFMPSPIGKPIERLAVASVSEPDPRVTSWLDLTLNFLRSRHPDMILIEREDLHALFTEVGIQYSGRVDDETMVRIGRLAGADSLLTYRIWFSRAGEPASASLELRLMNVENGITLFRQTTTARSSPAVMQVAGGRPSQQLITRVALEEAAAYGFAALTAAFGDNPLGIVLDRAGSGDGIAVLGILEGSPAARAGLKPGDRIVRANHQIVDDWTRPISLPANLAVDRQGEILEIQVLS